MSDAGMQSTFLFGSGSISGQVHTSAPSSDLEFNSNLADISVFSSRFPEKKHKKTSPMVLPMERVEESQLYYTSPLAKKQIGFHGLAPVP